MSTKEFKGQLCRCCHSEGNFQSLEASISVNKDKFVDMLHFVLDIHLFKVKEELETMIWAICDDCVKKLSDADNFKQQVLTCERVFRDLYGADLLTVEKRPNRKKTYSVPIVEKVKNVAVTNMGREDSTMPLRLEMEVFDDDDGVIEIKDVDETESEAPRNPPVNTRQLRQRQPKNYAYQNNSTKSNDKADKEVYAEGDTIELIDAETIKDEPKVHEVNVIFEEEEVNIDEKVDNDEKIDSEGEVNNDDGAADNSDDEIAISDEEQEKSDEEVAVDDTVKEESQSNLLEIRKKEPKKKKPRNLYLQNEDPTNVDGLLCADYGWPRESVLRPKITTQLKRFHSRVFQCDQCSESFSRQNNLEIHKNYRHVYSSIEPPKKASRSIKCEICLERFAVKVGMLKHKYEVHNIDQRYKCTVCEACFFLKKHLTNHLNAFHKRATDDNEHVNTDVGKIVVEIKVDKDEVAVDGDKEQAKSGEEEGLEDDNNYNAVKEESKSEVLEEKKKPKKPEPRYHPFQNKDITEVDGFFECAYCTKKHKLRKKMIAHVKRSHLRIREHQCDKCVESFSEERHLVVHKHYRHDYLNIKTPKNARTSFKCDICSEQFTSEHKKRKHKYEVHNVDKRYKCNACDAAYLFKVQLVNHLNTFHKLGPLFKCQRCDYECHNIVYMRRHELLHKDVRNYQCKYCQKSFRTNGNLHQHEMIHTGVRRKVCNECGQAFVQKASLNYHMTKYHPGVPF